MPSKWIVRLAIGAGIALLIATIFRLLTPPTPSIPESQLITTNTDGSQTAFSNVTYTGPDISAPPNLEVATVQVQEAPVVDQLTQDFQLQSASTTFKVWRGPEYSLTYSSQIDQYTLTLNTTEEGATAGINPTTARQVAEAFVQKYFPNEQLQLLENKINYSLDESDNPVPPAQAQAAFFPFSYSLQGLPLVLGQNNLLPVAVTTNQQNKLTKVVFTPAHLQLTSQGRKTTLSVAKAVENINKGQASITSAFQANFQTIDLAEVISGNLTTAEIQYRLDPDSKLAYPFYIFTGTVTNKENIDLQVEISTPAVAIN